MFLAETDTCPQNRYSAGAALLHAHFTGSILEGAKGAKHWITRLYSYEPNSGKAYRKKLAKYHKFYEKLAEYADELKPFGCRIPITVHQDYGFIESEKGIHISPWSSCVLERLGFPLYFGNDGDGAVFLDDISVSRFSDEEINKFFKGTLILSGTAAKKLCDRGFADHIGVEVREWDGKVISYEFIYGKRIATQIDRKELVIKNDNVKSLSYAAHKIDDDTYEELFPAVTSFDNPSGGCTVVFCGTPDTEYKYFSAFSMLNETRKQQFIDILGSRGHLPVYYPEDAEVYMRAGNLDNGEIFCAVFNLCLDELEDIPLVINKNFSKIEKLEPDGTRSNCKFDIIDSTVRVKEHAGVLEPIILFIS